MNRPKIQIPKSALDHVLEALPFILVVIEFYFIIHHYAELPDSMPRHFDGSGQPDAYGDKSTLWFPPIISVFLVSGMIYLTRFPHILNYLVEITEENAAVQYRLSQRMLRLLALVIAALFLYITVSTIYTGTGQWNGMGMWFMPVFILAMMGTLIPYLILSSKNA